MFETIEMSLVLEGQIWRIFIKRAFYNKSKKSFLEKAFDKYQEEKGFRIRERMKRRETEPKNLSEVNLIKANLWAN